MGRKKRIFTEDETKDIINMYSNQLFGIYNIGKKYSVGECVIRNLLTKHGLTIAKGSPYSKTYWIQRGLTEIEAIEHIKTLRPVNKEYWVKLGYSEDEAILQIEGQKMVSLRGCVARFGEEHGQKLWEDRESKRSEAGKKGSACLTYWLNKGYSEDEAIIKRSERQSTFTLEKCIEKYGEEEGKKRFTKRQNDWSKSLTKNGNLKLGYSKISQELFYKILEFYDTNEKQNIKFSTHNGEFRLNKPDGGIWLYDFTDINNKKIIEYNGDQYHANPKKYLSNDKPHPFRKGLTSKEIWDKDRLKLQLAKENGFEVLVIWDSEYRWGNKEKFINKCKKFLNI
jgi:hypothetical protein